MMEGHQQSGVPIVVHRCGNSRDLIAFQIINLMMRQMRQMPSAEGHQQLGPSWCRWGILDLIPNEISLLGR